ncbi:hypothetical protein EON64_06970, partial [archaeon]
MLFTTQSLAFTEKGPANTLFNELKERLNRQQPLHLYGAFGLSSYPVSSSLFPSILSAADLHVSLALSNPDANPSEDTSVSTSRSVRVSGSERAEARKRWLDVFERLQVILLPPRNSNNSSVTSSNGSNSNVTKTNYVEAQRLLDEARNISVPFSQALSSSAGSSQQSTEDFLVLEKIRSGLGELTRKIAVSRKWAAEVRDLLYSCLACCVLQDPVSKRCAASLSDFTDLLKRGEGLDLPVKEMEKELKDTIAYLEKTRER